MDGAPSFAIWLHEQRAASGLTLQEMAEQAGLSTAAIKQALRGVSPGRKAIRGLTGLFHAEEPWVENWLAATHQRHRAATLAWQAKRGPQPVPSTVIAELRSIAADPARPAWSRWAAGRMAELGVGRRALARAVDEPGSRGRVSALLDGSSTPARKTLDRLAQVLGPVPHEVLGASAVGRRAQNRVSQMTRQDRVRRWTKVRLTNHIGNWFRPAPIPKQIRLQLTGLSPEGSVGAEGFRVLMRAQARHMGMSVSPDYVPTGPEALGPQPRGALRRALIALRRQRQRGGLDARICGECGTLVLLPHVYARRSWRGRCDACWARFTVSSAGRLWTFEVFAARQAGLTAPPAPAPRRTRPGPSPDADRVAEGLIALFERALGEGVPDAEGERGRSIRDAERLLRAASNARCRRLVAALDELAGDTAHPYRAHQEAAATIRGERAAARARRRRGGPLLGECGHRVSARGVRLCLRCYRQSPRPLGPASRRVLEVVAELRATDERLVQERIARRARVSVPTVAKVLRANPALREGTVADAIYAVVKDQGHVKVLELLEHLEEMSAVVLSEKRRAPRYSTIYGAMLRDPRFERVGRGEFRVAAADSYPVTFAVADGA